jgi:ABC-2 type transport system ATP-binding protein
MAQKVQFIVTVLHQPKLLIFDEPFSGFDPINTNLLKDEIINLQKNGSTIIFSTHNMASVEELCDHIALINNSKVILSGEINEIKSRFKENRYEVVFRSPKDLIFDGSDIEIQEQFARNGEHVANLKTSGRLTSNEVLNQLIKQVEVVSFREILPSVNEIFIREVMKGG